MGFERCVFRSSAQWLADAEQDGDNFKYRIPYRPPADSTSAFLVAQSYTVLSISSVLSVPVDQLLGNCFPIAKTQWHR